MIVGLSSTLTACHYLGRVSAHLHHFTHAVDHLDRAIKEQEAIVTARARDKDRDLEAQYQAFDVLMQRVDPHIREPLNLTDIYGLLGSSCMNALELLEAERSDGNTDVRPLVGVSYRPFAITREEQQNATPPTDLPNFKDMVGHSLTRSRVDAAPAQFTTSQTSEDIWSHHTSTVSSLLSSAEAGADQQQQQQQQQQDDDDDAGAWVSVRCHPLQLTSRQMVYLCQQTPFLCFFEDNNQHDQPQPKDPKKKRARVKSSDVFRVGHPLIDLLAKGTQKRPYANGRLVRLVTAAAALSHRTNGRAANAQRAPPL
jgi:hypothetical protein